MNQVEYCIRVLWMRGASIGEIHKLVGAKSGKTQGAIRGLVDRAFEKRRDAMDKAERQEILNEMRSNRLDEEILDISDFIARPVKAVVRKKAVSAPAEKKPVTKKKMTVRERRKHEAGERKRREKREPGHAPRGTVTSPLELLFERGLLADQEEAKAGKVGAVTVGNALRRFEAGVRMRGYLVSAYSSGLKTQNFDSTGGGSGAGAGVVIHAVVAEALDNVRRFKGMIFPEEFRMIEEMLRADRFVWEVPASHARTIILDDVRRTLDAASVFFDMMTADDFRARWSMQIAEARPADSKSSRRRSRKARDAIAAAQRKAG